MAYLESDSIRILKSLMALDPNVSSPKIPLSFLQTALKISTPLASFGRYTSSHKLRVADLVATGLLLCMFSILLLLDDTIMLAVPTILISIFSSNSVYHALSKM